MLDQLNWFQLMSYIKNKKQLRIPVIASREYLSNADDTMYVPGPGCKAKPK